ncbi:conserved Plasmodium protein, unknown function [Plasmodium ovale curtisi]|nr:conserved Plasmodium protein, unknown function [Plasmodium ovale curtisi]
MQPEQSHNSTTNSNVGNKCDVRNLHDQNEQADYPFYKQPEGVHIVQQSGYPLLNASCYKHGEINTPSVNLYNTDAYINANNNLFIKPDNSFNVTPLTVSSRDVEHYDYSNIPLNANLDSYYNPYDMNNGFISGGDHINYDMINETEGSNIIPNLRTKLNNTYVNLSSRNDLSENLLNPEMGKYNDSNSMNDAYDYLDGNENIVNYDYLMQNYQPALCNNVSSMNGLSNINGMDNMHGMGGTYGLDNISFNSQAYGNSYNDENYIPLQVDNIPMQYSKEAQVSEREKKFTRLKNININKNSSQNHGSKLDELQAIVCLQKLEEIPTPFLNINEIKYSVSVYFNTYDDILQKYQSKFYSCKLNDSNAYADCDLHNEIINLPFNNEEYIYLKVIETSIYKTEITGRLQLKVKSLSQEYPLRIPIIGDDGNSKGFLIMNFFIISSYYDVKNDILTDRSTFPSRNKSTRIRRRNNGFHFFENFTKWCCEIADHHVN